MPFPFRISSKSRAQSLAHKETDVSSLSKVASYYKKAAIRLSAAESLSNRSSEIVSKVGRYVSNEFPIYFASDLLSSKCLRDIDFFLRLICNCLISGEKDPIDEWGNGLAEAYQCLDLSSECAVKALIHLKEKHGLVEKEALEANKYIDYLISCFNYRA